MQSVVRVESGITRRQLARPKRVNGKAYREVFDVSIKVPNGSGGYRNETRRGFLRISDARTARDALRVSRSRPSLTVKDYLRGWVKDLPAGLAVSTLSGYRSHIDRYLIPTYGDRPLADLSTIEVAKGLRKIGDAYGLSYETVKRIRATLSSALEEAALDGLLATNPAHMSRRAWRRYIGAPPTCEPAEKAWTAEELSHFLAHARENRLYPLFHFIAYTGTRRGEALGLRWRCVDLSQGLARIEESLPEVRGVPRPSAVKTAGSRRRITLDPATAAVLEAWALEQAREGASIRDFNPGGYVFPNRAGNPAKGSKVSEIFRRLVLETGLPPITLHGLRHTHATLLMRAEVPLASIQRRLGHSTAAFTASRYQHPDSHDDQAASEAFAALVGASPIPPVRGCAS